MGRFATTAEFYEQYRPPYPAKFFRTVAERLKLDKRHALIDLGTGPGVLALGFAPSVGRIVGVDPEPAMLAAARAAAARAGTEVSLHRRPRREPARRYRQFRRRHHRSRAALDGPHRARAGVRAAGRTRRGDRDLRVVLGSRWQQSVAGGLRYGAAPLVGRVVAVGVAQGRACAPQSRRCARAARIRRRRDRQGAGHA